MSGEGSRASAGPLDALVAQVRRLEATIASEFAPPSAADRSSAARARLLALFDDLTATRAALESEAGQLRREIARLDRSMSATSAYGAAGQTRQGARQ